MEWVSSRDMRPVKPVRLLGDKAASPATISTMFTGLIEQSSRILHFAPGERAWLLEVRCAEIAPRVSPGDSIAINGICLTVVAVAGKNLRFEVLEETRNRTTLGTLAPGSVVNIERSLKVGTRMGGHFVSGHVDALGRVETWEQRGADWFLRICPPKEFLRYVVFKGSIAVDGISLTVAEVDAQGFAVWIIPHTLEVTNLRDLKAGGLVNLEFDLLAKYAEKILESRLPSPAAS